MGPVSQEQAPSPGSGAGGVAAGCRQAASGLRPLLPAADSLQPRSPITVETLLWGSRLPALGLFSAPALGPQQKACRC